MSYENNYGRGTRSRGRGRAYRGGYNEYTRPGYNETSEQHDSGKVQDNRLRKGPRGRRGTDQHQKRHKFEELKEVDILETPCKYSKLELLEIYSSVEYQHALKRMKELDEKDILVKHCQDPVLLSEQEPLTLEELRPRKGEMGGRHHRNYEKVPDDYLEDEDPEWLDFDENK